MGYRNAKTGNLREQRRERRRLTTQAPVGQTGIGHGDGLRIYGEGKVILDGADLQIIFQILENAGFITYRATNRTGLRADPAFWGNENQFVVAGPLRDESTAATGYGGSNLYLTATYAALAAGIGGSTPAEVRVQDDGAVSIIGKNGQLHIYPDGAIDLLGSSGGAVRLQANGIVSLATSGAGFTGGPDGGWSAGDVLAAVIQGAPDGLLAIFSGGTTLNSNTRINGDLDVTGTKNFLMEHPGMPGHTIRYASTESPNSLIQCRGRVTVGDDGTADITFPEHFTAIIKPDTDIDVTVTPYGPDAAWCDVPTAAGTIVHGEPGTVVAWQALAERIGGDFTVIEEGTTAPDKPVPTQTPDTYPDEETT